MRKSTPALGETRVWPADAVTRARILDMAGQALPLAEWQARLAVPVTDDEHASTMELVRWFTRRYPTPAERLAYVRRA